MLITDTLIAATRVGKLIAFLESDANRVSWPDDKTNGHTRYVCKLTKAVRSSSGDCKSCFDVEIDAHFHTDQSAEGIAVIEQVLQILNGADAE